MPGCRREVPGWFCWRWYYCREQNSHSMTLPCLLIAEGFADVIASE